MSTAALIPEVTPNESKTRERVLELVVSDGPITASALAKSLGLTSAAIRRHTSTLESAQLIEERDSVGPAVTKRGRPARYYVATQRGQALLSNAYSDMAISSLRYLQQVVGNQAVADYGRNTFEDMYRRYQPAVAAAGDDLRARVIALSEQLSSDGHAATVREVGDGFAIQLCQGHCPVLRVAQEFPQLCAAEAQVFGKLLGVHVQRLATLAEGEHVCTTNVPLNAR